MMTRIALAASLLVPAIAAADNYQIDPQHTNASFTVKHAMIATVRGEFTKVSGKFNLDEKDLTKSVLEANIEAASVNTREPKRDTHLKSPDFLDVAKYPVITFKSTRITRLGKGKFKMTGDLTIHGVTKPVTFDVSGFEDLSQLPWGTVRGGIATATINRKDFGLVWNKPVDKVGGMLVGDDVNITLDVELVKAAQQAQK